MVPMPGLADKAADYMLDLIKAGMKPEELIFAFQRACERRCPAFGPSFLERMKSAIDALFD